ncbi:MAG: acyl-homoserine-lactone synthase [Boseongicola sp.]
MLRYIYADELHAYPQLASSMFRDRARQFHDRLGWEVSLRADGTERDQYDDRNPLYVIWQRANGTHVGSMRFLPTTADTMVNDHFLHLTDGVKIQSPFIWECTRFCLAPDADSRVSAKLMLAGLELGIGFNLSHAVGVFDARMVRIYRRLGWGPTVLGTSGSGRNAISVGLWAFETERYSRLLARAGVSAEISQHWFDRAFGQRGQNKVAISA